MKTRIAAGLLSLSLLGFVGRAIQEDYTGTAVIPVPGDVPTVGIGSTRRDDGTPVRLGDTITVPKAIRRAVTDISEDENVLRHCFGDAELYQHEWDAFSNLSYNVGAGAVCRSSIVGKVQAKRYEAACNTILDFYKAGGKDCRVRANNCYGVWLDRQRMNRLCLTGEYPKEWSAR